MSDNIKLIIEIPKELFERVHRFSSVPDMQGTDIVNAINAIANGTPLDKDSERAETQAYFAGEAYGWEQGRKALIDENKGEINFLNFLYQVIPPNEMEKYMEMYNCKNDKNNC